MRKTKTTAIKVFLSLCLVLMFVFTISLPASSANWLSQRIYIGGESISDNNIPLFNAAFGSFSSPMMYGNMDAISNVSVKELSLSEQQQIDLLFSISGGQYKEAEAMLAEFAAKNYGSNHSDSSSKFSYAAYQLEYHFTYDGALGENVYARFKTMGWYANSITINEVEHLCVQHVAYDSGSGLDSMEKFVFYGEDSYYYYPKLLSAGNSVKLIYTLFLPESTLENFMNVSDYFNNNYELILINNNASVIKWNIIFDEGMAYSFDDSVVSMNEYYNYIVDFTPPVDDTPITSKTPEPTSEPDIEPEAEPEIEPETESVTEPEATIEPETESETTTPSTTDIEPETEELTESHIEN